jgi:S1-C subfamily serine protease
MCIRQTCAVVVGLMVAVGVASIAAQSGDALYLCMSDSDTRALDIGATVCDAAPTDSLTQRMEVDNLQLRAGVLVTDVTVGDMAQIAGLAPGDVIYRVGGVDVGDNVLAAARLSLLMADTDTVVNFLRRGRPYRVKLRLP